MIDDVTIARGLHILGVVLWIGGVAMVTTVILPAVRKFKSPEDRARFFEAVEGRFALQARITTTLTGATGFYMLYALDGWHMYGKAEYWWVPGMTAIWFIFTMVLFVLEPLFLHRWFQEKARANPEKTFKLVHTLHAILLTASLVVVFGAVLGAH